MTSNNEDHKKDKPNTMQNTNLANESLLIDSNIGSSHQYIENAESILIKNERKSKVNSDVDNFSKSNESISLMKSQANINNISDKNFNTNSLKNEIFVYSDKLFDQRVNESINSNVLINNEHEIINDLSNDEKTIPVSEVFIEDLPNKIIPKEFGEKIKSISIKIHRSKMHRVFQLLIEGLHLKKLQIEESYLNQNLTFFEEKSNRFCVTHAYNSLMKQLKRYLLINKKKAENERKLIKCKNYRYYKIKHTFYHEINNLFQKRREWIKGIQKEIKKTTIWACIDNWKLYVNYKRIKRFLEMKKKSKIFTALNRNMKIGRNNLKKQEILKKILLLKFGFHKLRIHPYRIKNNKYNDILAIEFYRSSLIKRSFGLILEKHNRLRNLKSQKFENFDIKHRNAEYINLKVTKTTKIVKGGHTSSKDLIYKRITKNNIKIL
jgi:hypothetical protein